MHSALLHALSCAPIRDGLFPGTDEKDESVMVRTERSDGSSTSQSYPVVLSRLFSAPFKGGFLKPPVLLVVVDCAEQRWNLVDRWGLRAFAGLFFTRD